MRNRIVAAVIVLGVIACQEDRQVSTGLWSEVRDSAGIRISENAEPPEGSRLPWRIGPEPTVSIGVLEGEEPYMLLHVSHAARLSDGRIVMANAGTSEDYLLGTFLDELGVESIQLWPLDRSGG